MIEWREVSKAGDRDADPATFDMIWRDTGSVPELYRRLGIEPGCSPSEIKQAYRKLARQCHPDCQPLARRDEAERRMAALNAAYEVLGKPERRMHYDAEHGLATL